MRPWICPKCGRVWSGLVDQCLPCNRNVGTSEHTGRPIVPHGTSRYDMRRDTMRPKAAISQERAE